MDLGNAFLIMYIGPLRTVPSSSTSRYITDKVQVKNLVAIPTIAVIHIQKITPGPPYPIARATPEIFPRPIVPDNAVVKA